MREEAGAAFRQIKIYDYSPVPKVTTKVLPKVPTKKILDRPLPLNNSITS